MKRLHNDDAHLRHCGRVAVPAGRSRGFTMIEMMVVLAIIGLAASLAFSSVRQDQFAGSYERLVADLQGALVLARNHAIDEQTRVRIDLTKYAATVSAFNNTSHAWDVVDQRGIDLRDVELIGGDRVCVYGLQSGIQTPAQLEAGATALAAPTTCLAATQQLVFEADGSFTDPNGTIMTVENAGVTMWIADNRTAGEPKYSIIQLFPGGLIRSFERLEID